MNYADLEVCRETIRTGSYSFHAASKLLPANVRDPALVLYAFCRVSDDAVDLGKDKVGAVLRLRDRLDAVYEGRPQDKPIDRAFAAVVEEFEMPRALPEALLEGLAWDGAERRYETLSELRDYSARVASAVGAMMCVLMRVHEADALARACDLGVAMQLTNISRDVGEDAEAGRLYLPTKWFEEHGMDPDEWLSAPEANAEIRDMVKALLAEARWLYLRSEAGIQRLPLRVRTGIFAARYIYAAIGTDIKTHRYDSISRRAFTTKRQKLGLVGKSIGATAASLILPQSARLHAAPLSEVAFLVNAASKNAPNRWERRSDALVSVLAQLEAQDRSQELA